MVIRRPRRFFALATNDLDLRFFPSAVVSKAATMSPWSPWKSRTIWRAPNLEPAPEKPCPDCGSTGRWKRRGYPRTIGELEVGFSENWQSVSLLSFFILKTTNFRMRRLVQCSFQCNRKLDEESKNEVQLMRAQIQCVSNDGKNQM